MRRASVDSRALGAKRSLLDVFARPSAKTAPFARAATREAIIERSGRFASIAEMVVFVARVVLTAYGALLCASIVSPFARRGVRKVHDATRANAHLALSNEKGGKGTKADPAALGERATKTKTIVFIRHGESTWNEVFNRKFDHTFPMRLIGGLVMEATKFFSRDSFFMDAPLSALGVKQARDLGAHFAEIRAKRIAKAAMADDVVDAIVGVGKKSIIVSSNLRRAVNTTANVLWSRLSATETEKIVIHSALQEIARNVDTYALASSKGEVVPTPTLAKELGLKSLEGREICDASENAGQKPIGRKCRDSFRQFAAWTMNQDADVIIAGGHSIWFREFFRTYLPSDSDCAGKKKKIVNCGVVSFDLRFGVHPEHGEMYAIDNVREIYGGFSK